MSISTLLVASSELSVHSDFDLMLKQVTHRPSVSLLTRVSGPIQTQVDPRLIEVFIKQV
jgi:hypothetical protein